MAGVISREDIRRCHGVIRPYIRKTPVVQVDLNDLDEPAPGGPDAVDGFRPAWLKLEFLQCAGSFKARGAFTNLLLRDVPAAGVVAASGGNHGVAGRAGAAAGRRAGVPHHPALRRGRGARR